MLSVSGQNKLGEALDELAERAGDLDDAMTERFAERARSELSKAVSRFSRTGKTARSISIGNMSKNPPSVEVGSSQPHLGQLDRGGVVRARSGGLRIPVNRRSGRSGSGLSFVPRSSSSALLARLRGRQLVPEFVVRREIKTRPRRFIEPAVAKTIQAVDKDWPEVVDEVLD